MWPSSRALSLLLTAATLLWRDANSTRSHSTSAPFTPVRFAVTDVFLVRADTIDAATEICVRNAKAQTVGIDWGNANDRRVLQLCLRRERIDTLRSSNSTHVVQRLAVYESSERKSCLWTETELFRPTDDVVVCVRRLPLTQELIESGNFLSDTWVSTDKNYNSDLPGWSDVGASVLEPADSIWRRWWQWMWTPSYGGAFITVQRPLVPVREVRLVTVSKQDAHLDTCLDALGEVWEPAGRVHLDVEDDNNKRAVLCVRRGDTATSDKLSAALVGVQVLEGDDTKCEPSVGTTTTTVALGAKDRRLCLTWESPSSVSMSHSVIADLALADAKENKLRGQFERVSQHNVNTAGSNNIYLYQQSTWKSLELIDEPADENGLINKPPLVANVHVDASSNNASLSFKILQIADLHYSGDPTTSCHDVPIGMKSSDCSEALMTKFVNELLDLEKPDFVAFTGDNVQVYSKSLRQAAIDIVTKGVEERGIPFSVIFGNHDDQKGFSRQQQMKLFIQKPHAYSRRGPLNVDGVGNYELNIQASVDGAWGTKGTDVFRMYFVDSAAYPDDSKTPHHVSKYDWIKPSQIAYYRQLSQGHLAVNNSVPAIMFFHIPLPEYALDGQTLRTVGDHNEGVASSGVNTNMFASLVELGEVKAAFCGHDHVNDYCYKRNGVHLCYGGGVGFGTAYGKSSVKRRARVIEWSVDNENRRTIRSWRRIFGESDRRQLEEVLYADGSPLAMGTSVVADT